MGTNIRWQTGFWGLEVEAKFMVLGLNDWQVPTPQFMEPAGEGNKCWKLESREEAAVITFTTGWLQGILKSVKTSMRDEKYYLQPKGNFVLDPSPYSVAHIITIPWLVGVHKGSRKEEDISELVDSIK